MSQFKVNRVLQAPKLQLIATELSHHFSKHKHLHIKKTGDANRVFALAFKTRTANRTGVPHILEHTTLCGSERFPVRDPFFKMLNRSLANFMNALTGQDYTYYPFATTNKTDFRNLQQVYMDAVFKPLLKKTDFWQEGWRLEPKDPKQGVNENNPLEFKGVVYNEMKGQLSVPDYYYYTKWLHSVCPKLGFSGGDPLDIPSLEYKDLVEFHRQHYHRNNCFTYSYGDFDADEVLEPLSRYLSEFTPHVQVDNQQLAPIDLSTSKKITALGPVDPSSTGTYKTSLTWYLGRPERVSTLILWRVIAMLLSGGHSSPLYKALIDTNLGTDFSINTGIDEVPNQLMYTIGLQGVTRENIPKFKEAVFTALDEIVQNGLPESQIAALLHQFEFSNREIDANFGMNILDSVIGRVFVHDDYMKLIDTDKLLTNFKLKLQKYPNILVDSIKNCLGRNNPYLEFELAPSTDFESQVEAKYGANLKSKCDSLSLEMKQQIDAENQELIKDMADPGDLDLLPTINVNDIKPEINNYPVSNQVLTNNVNLKTRKTGTQGVSYLKIYRDMSGADLHLLPIYADAITNVGTQSRSMEELENFIRLNTGGVLASPSVTGWAVPELSYSASCLDSNVSKMYEIIEEVATQPALANTEKLRILVNSESSNIMNAVSNSGHLYAVNKAKAAFSKKHELSEELSGFSHLQNIAKLEVNDQLVSNLTKIHSNPWKVRTVALTCEDELNVHTQKISQFISNLNAFNALNSPSLSNFMPEITKPYLVPHSKVTIPSQISHIGSAIKLPLSSPTSKQSAAMQILAKLITTKYLHPEIREKNGAYGAGGAYDPLYGLMSLYSYRDPTPHFTEIKMLEVDKWASEQKFSRRDLDESKISIFQSIDGPISPRQEISFSLGMLSPEERQELRSNLLNLTLGELHAAAQQLTGPQSMCTVGPQAKPEAELEYTEHITM